MSGGRQTGTVPKTKHNTRSRRENTVNHIPNNLDWHDSYQPQRARKESNTSASRHSDAGEDMFEENPWLGLAVPPHRTDDDELRWSNVKSSNLTPERSSTLDAFIAANRVSLHRQENGPEVRDGPSTGKEPLTRGRIKLKMEQSQRKIEELEQQQAVYMSLRSKAIQQVKPVQAEEMHPPQAPMMNLRNKAIQQVKPVQQEELERAGTMDGRLPNIQEFVNMVQALERDETANLEASDVQSEQQLRKKLNELIAKKHQVDSILAYIESDTIGDAAASLSSDEGEGTMFSRGHVVGGGGDADEGSRRDVTKQDNREQATAAYLQMKEMKLEEAKNRLGQLQTLLARVERVQDSRPSHRKLEEAKGRLGKMQTMLARVERVLDSRPFHRMNGETSSHCSDPPIPTQAKNCPTNSALEKIHAKKFDLEHAMRKVKSNPASTQGFAFNQPPMENWGPTTSHALMQSNAVEYSSDEEEADYDESPVKLCSTSLQSYQSYLPQNSLPKTRGHTENLVNGPHMIGKHPTAGSSRSESRGCSLHPSLETEDRGRSQVQLPLQDLSVSPNNTALALQISQLQMQVEHMQILYQNMLEKQHVNVFPTPQPWLPSNSMGFMQYMPPSAQWHQHQLLVNSLNQCCQLIWHQQRELAGLRQALTMLQEEGSIYKCPTGGYGNNLNFDAGLLWTQPSPQMLNNQVPPGNRANNYWDNFRSYSRQNLLSGRNKSNEGSLADSLPLSRPPATLGNQRMKDNSTSVETRGNSTRFRSQPVPHPNGPQRTSEPNARVHRRFNASNNLKHEPADVVSLEQSVYSELETVITQSERSPDMLLRLLSQLKTMRSQHQQVCPFQDNNLLGLGNDCDLMEPSSSGYARMDHRNPPFEREAPKLEPLLEEIGRMIQECEICTPELLQQIVGFLVRALHLPPQSDNMSRLEASLLKFQATRLSQVGDELLCVIATFLSPHAPPMRPNPHALEEREVNLVEQIEEEGAVGGIPLPPAQRASPQSVETELAEADQPQHNSTDNVEVFDVEDPALPNIELDNLELPPREENLEQLHTT